MRNKFFRGGGVSEWDDGIDTRWGSVPPNIIQTRRDFEKVSTDFYEDHRYHISALPELYSIYIYAHGITFLVIELNIKLNIKDDVPIAVPDKYNTLHGDLFKYEQEQDSYKPGTLIRVSRMFGPSRPKRTIKKTKDEMDKLRSNTSDVNTFLLSAVIMLIKLITYLTQEVINYLETNKSELGDLVSTFEDTLTKLKKVSESITSSFKMTLLQINYPIIEPGCDFSGFRALFDDYIDILNLQRQEILKISEDMEIIYVPSKREVINKKSLPIGFFQKLEYNIRTY